MNEPINPLFDIDDHRNMPTRRSFIKIGAIGFLGLSLSMRKA